jgi:hypothetical protein
MVTSPILAARWLNEIIQILVFRGSVSIIYKLILKLPFLGIQSYSQILLPSFCSKHATETQITLTALSSQRINELLHFTIAIQPRIQNHGQNESESPVYNHMIINPPLHWWAAHARACSGYAVAILTTISINVSSPRLTFGGRFGFG